MAQSQKKIALKAKHNLRLRINLLWIKIFYKEIIRLRKKKKI